MGSIRFQASFNLTAERVNNSDIAYDLEARGESYSIDSDGMVMDPLGAALWQGELDVNAGDLSIFESLAGRPIGGRAELRTSGQAAVDLSVVDIEAELIAENLRTGLPGVDPVLNGPLRIDLSADREAGGSLAFDVAANGEAFQVRSEGEVRAVLADRVRPGTQDTAEVEEEPAHVVQGAKAGARRSMPARISCR